MLIIKSLIWRICRHNTEYHLFHQSTIASIYFHWLMKMCMLYIANMIFLWCCFAVTNDTSSFLIKPQRMRGSPVSVLPWLLYCASVLYSLVAKIVSSQSFSSKCFLLILMRKDTGWRVWACWINTVKSLESQIQKWPSLKFRAVWFLVKLFQTQHHCLFRAFASFLSLLGPRAVNVSAPGPINMSPGWTISLNQALCKIKVVHPLLMLQTRAGDRRRQRLGASGS